MIVLVLDLIFLRNIFLCFIIVFDQEMEKRPISTLLSRTLGVTDKTWISMGQLEKNILQATKTRIDNVQQLPILAKGKSDINVVSPFYDRNKICKNVNCQCLYHKRIKMQALRKFRPQNTKKTVTSHPSPNKQFQTTVISPRMSFNHSLSKQNMTPLHKNIEKLDFNSIGKQVDSYNKQFEDFLKQMNQMLLKKGEYTVINNHKIKTSVQKIFRYIYNNLDKEKQIISDYVKNIEKDRDITQLYIQRYQDLKFRKGHKQVIQRVDSFRTDRKGQNSQRKKQSSFHRKADRHLTRQKTVKKKTQRYLVIAKMIKDIEDGIQIQEEQINYLKDLNIQLFQQNCHYLKQKLHKFDIQTLQEIKQEILLRLKFSKSMKQDQQSDQYKKSVMIKELLKKMNERIQQIQQQNDKQYQKQHYDRISSSYSKVNSSRKGSTDHRGSRRPSNFYDGNKKSTFIDSTKQEDGRGFEVNLSKSQENQDDKGINQGGRHSNKSNTIFAINQFDNSIKQPTKRSMGKLKLAKYRKMSHDGFFQKPFFCDDNFNILPNVQGSTREQISQGLDNLASQFGDNWNKMKQIQRRISGMKMNKLIVNATDSLITAKRKARLLKNLLKENVFQGTVKEEIKQYIGLIQQFNLVKNRQWAENKLRKMAGIGTSDQTQIGEYTQEPTEDFVKKMLAQVFSKKKKLLYYLVDQVQFQQIQINLEGHLFESLQRQLQLQHKRSNIELKRKTGKPIKKQELKQQQKVKFDDDLVQSGLQDHYISQFCFEETVNVLRNKRHDLEQTSPKIKSMNNSILSNLREFSKYGF